MPRSYWRQDWVRSAPRDRGQCYFWVESERRKLSAPFSRRIAQSLDADAAGEATFCRCFGKIGGEESERHGHIDLPNAAFFASAKLSHRGYST
jgi:hypothetical protein